MARDLQVDLYWSFRSPYSYLALPRVEALARERGVRWNVRIVYPLAVRYPEHFGRQHPLARPYFFADSARVAEYLGMPFRRPVPDPIVQDPRTLAIAADQPYIRRLTHLGIEADRRGRALPFIVQASRLLWDGSVDGWDRGDHLAQAARRAGLDLDDMERAIAADPSIHESAVEANQRDQLAAGHWGVPLFVFDGEAFFGQDRFDLLVWRLAQRGLVPAA
ncbi:2-hydroxychromene-2-carboxylate isomerase [Pigmentiphaga soli]|uniref:2-hydroxychromene-2-carboxylate isomerase n=1 Tax=Pigmentiphaga soli TaxID=1007095 RepID=A0ABP8GUW2_9BURK